MVERLQGNSTRRRYTLQCKRLIPCCAQINKYLSLRCTGYYDLLSLGIIVTFLPSDQKPRKPDSPTVRQSTFCLSDCRAYGLIRPMNKKEAAAYLNVSTRAIERYTAQGKLTPTYEKGRTGSAPVYDQAQLDELKKQMEEAGDSSRAAVQHDKPAKHDKRDKGDIAGALVLRSGSRADLAAFIAVLDKARGPSVADIAAKPLLTRVEAQRYTGLSRELLHEEVESGKVKEVKLGRAYRIKRTDLDAYIEQL